MKKYELVQTTNINVDMEELLDEVIRYFTDVFEPEDYHLIDSVSIECAIECAVECQNYSDIVYSEYNNWSEIICNVYRDMVEYIDTNNFEHDLVAVIKDNAI